MRLVIDLQGAQSGSSGGRGIGRFSRSLALAMARAPGPHEPIILLNDAIPEAAARLGDEFAAILPRANIRTWRGLTQLAEGDPANVARRRATEVIRAQVLAGLDADLVHVASMVEGISDDVVSSWPAGLERPPTVATFYDAIPLILRDQYLDGAWQSWPMTAWYFRQLQQLRECDGLLAISSSSHDEAIEYLGFDASRVFNIRAGFDSQKFFPRRLDGEQRAAFFARYGLREGFVLFVGAGDLRKNEIGLVEAYASLPEALCAEHQLVIVGAMEPARLRQQAALLGANPHTLLLLDYIPEEDLPILYSVCRVFVMPSKHEGFGLPALEAMACGAPVIASNRSSLPEVVGLEEALFDPYAPTSIATQLLRALTDHDFNVRLAAHGVAQAQRFSWTESARRAWAALEQIHESSGSSGRLARGAVPRRKPRIACVGPLPPDASGVADYARDLLPALARYYDITLVTASGATDDPWLKAAFPVLGEDRFAECAETFDRILYQVGNSEFHIAIVDDLLPRYPGVVVLHDSFLCNIPFIAWMRTGDTDALARALFDSHGWGAVMALSRQPPPEAVQQFSCSAPIFRHALGVIQHSAHARDIIAQQVGDEAAARVRIVPLCRAPWPRIARKAARAALGLDEYTPLIGTFGIVGPPKRPFDVLVVWEIAMQSHSDALLAFVGAVPPGLAGEIRSLTKQAGLEDRVILTDRVDEARYRLWLAAADIAVQIRTGSRGETSAAIADAMISGVPVITNAHGSAAELPQNAVLLLPNNASNAELAQALSALWRDPERRQALGDAAARYARYALAPRLSAELYYEAIEDAYSRGTAARLQAALPDLPAEDLPEAARSLTQCFPPIAPKRLLLDAASVASGESEAGRLLAELARHVLIAPGPGWTADLVRVDGGTLHHTRRTAAEMLGLPDHGLKDLPVAGGPGDTLTFVMATGLDPDQVGRAIELRRLRSRGVEIVGIYQRAAQRDGAAALYQALDGVDAALCLSRRDAEAILADLNGGATGRRRPLAIGWLELEQAPAADDLAAAFLALVRSKRWPMQWPPTASEPAATPVVPAVRYPESEPAT